MNRISWNEYFILITKFLMISIGLTKFKEPELYPDELSKRLLEESKIEIEFL